MANIETMRNIIRNKNKELYVIISHADLDGIASSFLLGNFLEKETDLNMINVVCMDPTQKATNEMLEEVCKSIKKENFDIKVIIADRDIASKEVLNKNKIKEIFWLDHHITNINNYKLNKDDYKDIKVYEFLTEESYLSATSMVYYCLLYMIEHNIITLPFNFSDDKKKEIVASHTFPLDDLVPLWDTFTWKQKVLPKYYNELDRKECLILAKASYILPAKLMYDVFSNNNFEDLLPKLEFASNIFCYNFNEVYKNAKAKGKEIVFELEKEKVKALVVTDLKSEYISLFADKIFEETDIDVVIAINSNGLISCRASQKTEFDVSKLMQKFGNFIGFSGGGHKKAAGCRYKEFKDPTISEKELKDILINLYRVAVYIDEEEK